MRPGVSPAGFAAAAETTNVAGRRRARLQAGRPGLGSVWFAQMASYDALAVASAVGRAVPRISAGTAVVPIYPRHPQILASAAKTAQAATGGRFQLKSTTPATRVHHQWTRGREKGGRGEAEINAITAKPWVRRVVTWQLSGEQPKDLRLSWSVDPQARVELG